MSKIISVERQGWPCAPGMAAEVLAVLVQDGQNRYRAYVGLVPVRREGDPLFDSDIAWVAARGRKMTYAEAFPRYFVGVKQEDYAS